MDLRIQFELKKNPYYLEYLHANSYWYKILTRDPTKIDAFKKEYKDYQKKLKFNKFTSTLEYIEMLQTIMSSIK